MDLKSKYFIMYAKFDGSKCDETNKVINKGDIVAYLKPVKGVCGGRVYCTESNLFREAMNNISITSFSISDDDYNNVKQL